MSKIPALEKIRRNIQLTTWRNELRALKLADIRKKAPGFYEASGGDKMIIKPYSDTTTSGLTKCIIDWLQFNGHYANRINTQGQARVKKIPRYSIFSGKIEYTDKVEYTKGTTARGTPDIDAIINGMAVKIEVKAGKDKIRDEQIVQGEKIQAAGGIYYIARNMPEFVEWYKKMFCKHL